jgi:CheY-like chemotaxis protein
MRSVLVIDDDADIRAAALPELLLLDVMMPFMNGVQFRAEQKK